MDRPTIERKIKTFTCFSVERNNMDLFEKQVNEFLASLHYQDIFGVSWQMNNDGEVILIVDYVVNKGVVENAPKQVSPLNVQVVNP